MTRHRARLRPRGEPRLRTSFGWFHERMLSGFATDPSDPTRKFVVELFLDGLPIRIARADEYVHELAQEGVGDGCYGFSFPLRDDLLAEGVVAEARIANVGTPIGAPITFANRAGASKSNDGSGSVRWLGGLRFSGWLGEDARERTLDVLVDGELVAQTEFSGWSNVGADPQTARAARAFAVHLPEKFADGQARQLAVVKANGDSLPGALSAAAVDAAAARAAAAGSRRHGRLRRHGRHGGEPPGANPRSMGRGVASADCRAFRLRPQIGSNVPRPRRRRLRLRGVWAGRHDPRPDRA